jgi:molecular chaperone DnaK
MSWSEREQAVGITIGNAQSRAAIWEGDRAALVPLEEGEPAMASAVLLHRLREVGKYAYLYSGTDPNLLVTSINRLMGRSYQELSDELKSLPFEARNQRNCIRVVDWLGGVYSPIELYAMILRKLRQASERYAGKAVERAVIAVPGSFDDYQRRSVRKAAESVFRAVKLINEPTAALLAMAETENLGRDFRLMTFDMGAGKCEVSIIHRAKDNNLRLEAITGDTHLGGDDIDRLIFDHLAKQFQRSTGESMIGESAMARHEVLMAVRAAKHQLETAEYANINVPFVNFDRFGKPLHLSAIITRKLVADLCKDLLDRAAALIKKCMQDAGSPKLAKTLLLGGSTRLPFISQRVYQTARTNIMRANNPDELAVWALASMASNWRGAESVIK